VEAVQRPPVQALELLPEPELEPELELARQRAAPLAMPARVPPEEAVTEAVEAAPAPQRSSIRKLPREAVAMRALRDS